MLPPKLSPGKPHSKGTHCQSQCAPVTAKCPESQQAKPASQPRGAPELGSTPQPQRGEHVNRAQRHMQLLQLEA
jgi:hypothetical protein